MPITVQTCINEIMIRAIDKIVNQPDNAQSAQHSKKKVNVVTNHEYRSFATEWILPQVRPFHYHRGMESTAFSYRRQTVAVLNSTAL